MSNDYGIEYESDYTDADIAALRRSHERVFGIVRSIIIMITVVVIVFISSAAWRNWRGGAGTNQAALYDDNVEKVSSARAAMSAILNTSQTALDLLNRYTDDSQSVADFSTVRTRSQKLMGESPTYYSVQPYTQAQYVAANQQLETYYNRLVNLTSQIANAMNTAGEGDVEAGVTAARASLQSQVNSASALLDSYNNQTIARQATVTSGYLSAMRDDLADANADLESYREDDAPYVLLRYRQAFEQDNTALAASQESLRQAYSASRAAGGVAGNPRLAIPTDLIPSGIRTTWTAAGDDSVSVTFTESTMTVTGADVHADSTSTATAGSSPSESPSESPSPTPSASATASGPSQDSGTHVMHASYALAPGQRNDFGGSPIAAWTLTSASVEKIPDVTLVLYQMGEGDSATLFLGYYQQGKSWKLTTTDPLPDLVNVY